MIKTLSLSHTTHYLKASCEWEKRENDKREWECEIQVMAVSRSQTRKERERDLCVKRTVATPANKWGNDCRILVVAVTAAAGESSPAERKKNKISDDETTVEWEKEKKRETVWSGITCPGPAPGLSVSLSLLDFGSKNVVADVCARNGREGATYLTNGAMRWDAKWREAGRHTQHTHE